MSVIQRRKIEYKKGSTYSVNCEIFKSTMELVETCKGRKITSYSFDNQATKRIDSSWTGVKSYKEALDLMNEGWNEKVKELDAVVAACKQRQMDKRIGFKNDVHGFVPVVPLAIMGLPNSMINTTIRSIKSKIVDIYYNMSVTCGVSSSTIIDNGRKVVELVTKLENNGYRVSLNVVQAYSDSESTDMLVVNVKTANQLLDLKRICFPTMHTAFFRVIGFDWYSKFPIGKYRSGYGTDISKKITMAGTKELFKQMFGKEAVYIDANELMNEASTDNMLKAIKGE